jgi:amino acid permease
MVIQKLPIKGRKFYKFRNIYITIPTILISTIVAVLYDKILNYISILGGFCSVVIAFIFPGKGTLIKVFSMLRRMNIL